MKNLMKIKEIIDTLSNEKEEINKNKIDWIIVNRKFAEVLTPSKDIIERNRDTVVENLYYYGVIDIKYCWNINGAKIYVDKFLPDTEIKYKRRGFGMETLKIEW